MSNPQTIDSSLIVLAAKLILDHPEVNSEKCSFWFDHEDETVVMVDAVDQTIIDMVPFP